MNRPLYVDIAKYGMKSFAVESFEVPDEELEDRENDMILAFDTVENGYNTRVNNTGPTKYPGGAVSTSFTIANDIREELRRRAEKEGCSISFYLNNLLRKALNIG